MMNTMFVFLAAFFVGCYSFDWDEPTALDFYVQQDDGFFQWTELKSYRFDDDELTVYMLNMTSQKWMDESFCSRSVWWHMMGVAVPDNIRHEAAYLFIDGGSKNGPGTQPPGNESEHVNLIRFGARDTGAIAAFILQVPNQSIVFANDPDQNSKSEDAIIAWTWKTYTEERKDQPEVILRCPMTKAAKRGLDTINELVAQKVPGVDIQRFYAGGGSKRGWTTWSLAATDRRVVGITPMVMSLMNFNDTLQGHYRNLGGGWSFVFKDYYDVNLTAHIHDDIVVNGLWNYEDMYRYKERLAPIPKLMISATGDEFFLCTDSHTWWTGMEGPKWISFVPNAEHSLAPWYPKVYYTTISWLYYLLENIELPTITWTRGTNQIHMVTNQIPDNITAWVAHTWKNDTRKDFRLAVYYPPFIHPVFWRRENVTDMGNGNYHFDLEEQELGFEGAFIDAVYVSPLGYDMHLTTEVHVSPDIYPHPPCYGEQCYAYLT